MRPSDARLEAEIIEIVKRVSRRPVAPVAESHLALDLGFDSLQRFELIAELEDHFDVSIPLNETGTIETVGELREHLCTLRTAQVNPR